MKFLLLFLPFVFLLSCGSATKKVSKANKEETGPSIFDKQYYQDLQLNIVRLFHLMQGTFIAHSEGQDENLTSWSVSEGDSVVLLVEPLGEVAKIGYWTYSYEFMTSLPDDPLYTAIRQIQKISRDTYEISYYKVPVELTLKEVIDPDIRNEKINTKLLIKLDKKVVFVKKTASDFIGSSLIYEDKQYNCMRQNSYEVNPEVYKVNATFYDLKTKEEIEKKNRPNLLVRRDMSLELLMEIAAKEDFEEEEN